ncbi:F-box/kelch-repeat protein At3g23880-like [Bidens hawaiensis]|uniref:F-box/kelch-repeat protein At3g23880-like n=1 Tax=Bidens hawaiensis TaxID=980011 RepID=UPI00404ABD83
MADQFPPDTIYQILSRLPIKSLARFRCVCKSWLEYINDPYLETIHVAEEPTPIMFQQHSYVHPNNEVKEYCKISFLRAKQLETLVLGSCNGLILVRYDENHPSYNGTLLAFINPITKRRYNLPPVTVIYDFGNWFYLLTLRATGIGFDDSINTLKTVCIILKGRLHDHPLDVNLARERLCTVVHDSRMSSWREIAQVPAYPVCGEGVFAHGRLHWQVLSNLGSPEEGTKVVWFDVKMEEFGLIDAPKREGGGWFSDKLVDLNGELGYAYYESRSRVDLWMLKQEKWVLHCRFDLNHSGSCYYTYVEVLCCCNKEGDILLSLDSGIRLLVYTLKTGDIRAVGRGERRVSDILMYRSSLFSIRTSAY